jgi:hypothetical protein
MSKIAYKANRIASVFERFATNYEFPHRLDPNRQGAEIGVPDRGRLIHARYNFDPSEDGYEWAANIGPVSRSQRGRVALNVMRSKPVRGVTERILRDRLVIAGSRDTLSNASDTEIQRGFMDDISRISSCHRRKDEFFGRDDEDDDITPK